MLGKCSSQIYCWILYFQILHIYELIFLLLADIYITGCGIGFFQIYSNFQFQFYSTMMRTP